MLCPLITGVVAKDWVLGVVIVSLWNGVVVLGVEGFLDSNPI